jgi:hypothetical protein
MCEHCTDKEIPMFLHEMVKELKKISNSLDKLAIVKECEHFENEDLHRITCPSCGPKVLTERKKDE